MGYLVDQQPVRRDVALAAADIVAGERVVAVLFRERLFLGEKLHNVLQQAHVIAAADDALIVPAEGCLKLNRQH